MPTRWPLTGATFGNDRVDYVLLRAGDLPVGKRTRRHIRELALEQGLVEPEPGRRCEFYFAVLDMQAGLPDDCRVVLTYDLPAAKLPDFGPNPVPECALSSLKELACFKRTSGEWRSLNIPDFGVDFADPEILCLFLARRPSDLKPVVLDLPFPAAA